VVKYIYIYMYIYIYIQKAPVAWGFHKVEQYGIKGSSLSRIDYCSQSVSFNGLSFTSLNITRGKTNTWPHT